jgi:HEAT repeat protein
MRAIEQYFSDRLHFFPSPREMKRLDRYVTPPRRFSTHIITPDALLAQRSRALLLGAPGCGKSTLLKYFALKSLRQPSLVLPLLIDLKASKLGGWHTSADGFVAFLFAHSLAPHTSAQSDLHALQWFAERIRAGEVLILLDGLDEVRSDPSFQAFCHLVDTFLLSEYRRAPLVLSSRPHAAVTGFRNLTTAEIQPMTPIQIKDFLYHYYASSPAVDALWGELESASSELLQLASNPFTLSVLAHVRLSMHRAPNRVVELYEQIVVQLISALDAAKRVRRFAIIDADGSLKRGFLQSLALTAMLTRTHEPEHRFTFAGRDLNYRAAQYCDQKGIADVPTFVDDIKATAALRRVGGDMWAFSHLTVHEYLAACEIVASENPAGLCEQVFHDPVLVELEVLPMAIGIMPEQGTLMDSVWQWSESLTLCRLRTALRGLGYQADPDPLHVRRAGEEVARALLADGDTAWLFRKNIERWVQMLPSTLRIAVAEAVYRSAANGRDGQGAGKLGWMGARSERRRVMDRLELGRIAIHARRDAVLTEFKNALSSTDEGVRYTAARGLPRLDDRALLSETVQAIRAGNSDSQHLCEALAEIQSVSLVEMISEALLSTDTAFISRVLAAINGSHYAPTVRSLAKLCRDKQRTLALVKAEPRRNERGRTEKDDVDSAKYLRHGVVEALGRIRIPEAQDTLLEVLTDREENDYVRSEAGRALLVQMDERVVETMARMLLPGADSGWMREFATVNLARIGDPRAIEKLLADIVNNEKYGSIALHVASAAADANCVEAVGPLIQRLQVSSDDEEKWSVVIALGFLRDRAAVGPIVAALRNRNVRRAGIIALGLIGDVSVVDHLRPYRASLSKETRQAAVWALGRLGVASTARQLRHIAYHGEHPFIFNIHFPTRPDAANVMKMVRTQETAYYLAVMVCSHPDYPVRFRAAWSLLSQRIGDISDAMARCRWHWRPAVRRLARQVGGYYERAVRFGGSEVQHART